MSVTTPPSVLSRLDRFLVRPLQRRTSRSNTFGGFRGSSSSEPRLLTPYLRTAAEALCNKRASAAKVVQKFLSPSLLLILHIPVSCPSFPSLMPKLSSISSLTNTAINQKFHQTPKGHSFPTSLERRIGFPPNLRVNSRLQVLPFSPSPSPLLSTRRAVKVSNLHRGVSNVGVLFPVLAFLHSPGFLNFQRVVKYVRVDGL